MSSSIVTKIDWSGTINQPETINQSRVSRSNSGAGSKNRTRDLMITNQLLYQLSYTGETVGANRGSRRVYLSRPTALSELGYLSPIGGFTAPLLFTIRQSSLFTPSSPDLGGGRRDRTADILLAKQTLSQLSYTPESFII
jgi:hypothetical protein